MSNEENKTESKRGRKAKSAETVSAETKKATKPRGAKGLYSVYLRARAAALMGAKPSEHLDTAINAVAGADVADDPKFLAAVVLGLDAREGNLMSQDKLPSTVAELLGKDDASVQ